MYKKALYRGAQKAKEIKDGIQQKFKANIITAVLAAFGLIIALVWRDVIQSSVDMVLLYLGVQNSADLISKLITAALVTLICAIGIFAFSKYKEE